MRPHLNRLTFRLWMHYKWQRAALKKAPVTQLQQLEHRLCWTQMTIARRHRPLRLIVVMITTAVRSQIHRMHNRAHLHLRPRSPSRSMQIHPPTGIFRIENVVVESMVECERPVTSVCPTSLHSSLRSWIEPIVSATGNIPRWNFGWRR